MLGIELVCPECETRATGDEFDLVSLPLCSVCLRGKKFRVLMSAAHYDANERQKELSKRLYCRDCGHIGLIEQFPFDAPAEDDARERRCPRCYSDNVVNMGTVKMCENCDEVPAAKKEVWCKVCIDGYNKGLEDT